MSIIQPRYQNTIQRTATVTGFGLFGGQDVALEFCPAPPHHGIIFERTDRSTPVRIPAIVDNIVARPRCSVISADGSSVAVVEHVMAALAGLQIDNCLIRINAPEPPTGDGSSQVFVEALERGGICPQDHKRDCLVVSENAVVVDSEHVGVAVQPPRGDEYEIGFMLHYHDDVIGKQCLRTTITPETFVNELSSCRTFILENEVEKIQAAGIGLRATPQNILVFGPEGPVDNEVRADDECVRHKILDCVGDFALLGCDVQGRFTATQSGHRHNHSIIRILRNLYLSQRQSHPDETSHLPPAIRAAG